ncbi:MAG: ATP synthase F0 subunit C [Bacteriovoracaceae bacterium]|nr:ATP synthase F0 subunit C [Bacteriovoracaceae bacterium]
MRNFFIIVATLIPSLAFADTTDASVFAWSSAAAIAIAAACGAFAQSKAAAVALDGIARNPAAADKLFTPMIIALALIESLVIYAFVIAFLIKPVVS